MTVAVAPVRLASDACAVRIIDQRRLPAEYVERDLTTIPEVIEAITTLAVRGAPAIGICAAAGLAMAAQADRGLAREDFIARFDARATQVAAARPTAVNLAWAVERCRSVVARTPGDGSRLADALAADARALCDEDIAMGLAIGEHGLALFPGEVRVLTHCNAGALATGGAGTALAPVYAAQRAGRAVLVYATETRPLLQGARLTSWELQRSGVDVTVLADGAAASLMRERLVDAVIVGADRIARNGDVANKIGTYALALAAAHHGIPLYVCAPWSTVDPGTPDGNAIPIEMRSRDELAVAGGATILPAGVPVWAPAFDVTPAALVAAIVTDRGVHRPPYQFTAS